MSGFELLVVEPSGWAGAVAELLADRLRSKPALRLCLPTGDTPVPVFDAIVELAAGGTCSFGAATVVQLDEWVGLPPGDPARCDTRLRAQLLERLAPAPAAWLFDVDAASLDEAVAHQAAEAARLDLVLLGLGMNGHVGFNEPGSGPEEVTRIVRLAASSREAATARYGAAAVPAGGVTIGLAEILAAGEIWLLVTGERKAGILRRTLREPVGLDCPASHLRRHAALRVFVDTEAASLL